jgi:hypothetical protein
MGKMTTDSTYEWRKIGEQVSNTICHKQTQELANSVLFDHLVGTGQQRSWNLDAKLLRSLEVDE